MPRGGFQMCSFEPRRYSICQIFSDLSKNKSKVKKKILTFAEFDTWVASPSIFLCWVSGHEPVPDFNFPSLPRSHGKENVTITPTPQSQPCSKLFCLVANFLQSGETCSLQRQQRKQMQRWGWGRQEIQVSMRARYLPFYAHHLIFYFRFRWLKTMKVECRKRKGMGFEFHLTCILKGGAHRQMMGYKQKRIQTQDLA